MLNINELHPQYLIDEQGKKIAIVLAIDTFEQLLADIRVLAASIKHKSEA